MENLTKKENLLFWRERYLQVMLIASLTFQRTRDPKIMEYIKYFGQESEKLKNELCKLK